MGDTFLKHFNLNIWKWKFRENICETFLKHLHENFMNKSCCRKVATTFMKHCLRNFCLHKFGGNISATFLKHFLNFLIEKKFFFSFQFFSLSLRMRDVFFTPYNPNKKKKKTGPSSLNQDASKSTPIGFELRTFSLWGGRPT